MKEKSLQEILFDIQNKLVIHKENLSKYNENSFKLENEINCE